MKVFIFGAGASYSSQVGVDPGDYLRAPLVDNLFNEQYHRYGEGVLTKTALANSKEKLVYSKKTLEDWLTEKWLNIEKHNQNSTRRAERSFFALLNYYIWRLMQKVSETYSETTNTYGLFMKRLKERDDLFGLISFNYDTLLDRAVQDQFSYSLSTLKTYLDFPLIKPHGSINWLLPPRKEDERILQEASQDVAARLRLASSQLYEGVSLHLSDLVVKDPAHRDLIEWHTTIAAMGNQFFYPLIFLPLIRKEFSVVSAFYEKVIKAGNEIIKQADEIFLIGYRAKDEVIREMFLELKQGVLLHVVSTERSADQIMNEVLTWAKNLKRGEVYKNGFSAFVESY